MNKTICSLVFAAFAVGCSRVNESDALKPADKKEIAKATFDIVAGGVTVGQGVFVGTRDAHNRSWERVFVLTARHVATSAYVANSSQILIQPCGGADIPISTSMERWWAHPRPEIDLAWLELNYDECKKLKAATGMAYISMTEEPYFETGCAVRGTGCTRLGAALKAGAVREETDVALFFLSGEEDGFLDPSKKGNCPVEAPYNKTLKHFEPWVVGARSGNKVAYPGDSGGAAFCKKRINGRDYWMLVGLMVGGSDENGVLYSLVNPLDMFLRSWQGEAMPLSELPPLWEGRPYEKFDSDCRNEHPDCRSCKCN